MNADNQNPNNQNPNNQNPNEPNPSEPNPSEPIDDAGEARIDELARSAGSELRRPAPEHGLASVKRGGRNRQITRAAVGGTAVLALVVGGFVAANSRDDGSRIEPSDSVTTAADPDSTVAPAPSVAPPTTTLIEPAPTAGPDTSGPTATAPALEVPTSDLLPAVDAPVVYTSTEPFSGIGGTMTLVNPVDGSVIGTEPIDVEKSRIAWEAFGLQDRSTVDLGEVAYEFTTPREEAGQLDTDLFPDVDLCFQDALTVTGPAGSALPERARLVRVSPDDRFVVTLSATCPEIGTLDGVRLQTQRPYNLTLQVFDAQRPEVAGRVLAEIPSTEAPTGLTASGDGRFISVETFAENAGYRIFDLENATEVDLGIDLGIDLGADCRFFGTTYSRFIGPWIGESSIAINVSCPTTATLVVLDLTDPDNRLTVPHPDSTDGGFPVTAVDYDSYASPQDVWFTMCDPNAPKCFVGHGTDPLIELTDVAQAAFIPLGFEPGG